MESAVRFIIPTWRLLCANLIEMLSIREQEWTDQKREKLKGRSGQMKHKTLPVLNPEHGDHSGTTQRKRFK